MKNFRVLLLALLLGLSCTAFAQQVYKSTDAEGNLTYSDTPSTGDQAVQVEETNVADPVNVQKDEAFVPAPAPEPKVTQQQAPPQPTAETHDDDDDYRRNRGARTLRRHHRMDHRRR